MVLERCARILLALPLLLVAAEKSAPRVILIVGPPGSGKTTQAKKVSRKYGIPSFNLADLLKQSAGWGKAGSRKAVKAQIESGELVNDDAADVAVRERLMRADVARGFILDGYPANGKQAGNLEALLKEKGLPGPTVLYLEVSDSTAIERMRSRGRADDKPEIMRRRLDEFRGQSGAILDRYRGDRTIRVDASRSEQEVWRQIESALSGAR